MIKKIVLTGGPGAGKSTIINFLKENLEKKGYKVLTISETATDLYNNGIIFEKGITTPYNFQKYILELQYAKEKSLDEYIKKEKFNKPIIILYDRGIFDNKAYLENDQTFSELLNLKGLNEIDLLDEYDLVIDMVSAAILDDNFYQNNDLRKETKQEARILDNKTTDAWILHHNFNIVMPTINVEDKKIKVLEIINEFLSNNKKINYYFKKVNNICYDEFNDKKYKKISEFDINLNLGKYDLDYLVSCGAPLDSDFIVTKRNLNNKISYLYRIITHSNNNDFLYKSTKISKEYYELLINNHDIKETINNNYIKYFDNYNVEEIKFNNKGVFKKIIL